MLTGEALRQRLAAYREQNWKGVQTPEWQRKIVERQLAADYRPMVREVLRRYDLGTETSWLDVGSGIGDCVLAARALGVRAFGIEPDRIGVGSSDHSLSIAMARWGGDSVFVNGIAEHLPFRASSFDVVTLNQVVEHVQDVEMTLNEGLRVLRPGGILLISAPNYLSFYEPHYKIFWFPLFPRPLAKMYLRLLGRDPAFLDGINYVTRTRLSTILSKLSCGFVDTDEAHLQQLAAEPERLRRPGIRVAVRALRVLRLLNPVIFVYLNFLHRGLNFAVTKSSGAGA